MYRKVICIFVLLLVSLTSSCLSRDKESVSGQIHKTSIVIPARDPITDAAAEAWARKVVKELTSGPVDTEPVTLFRVVHLVEAIIFFVPPLRINEQDALAHYAKTGDPSLCEEASRQLLREASPSQVDMAFFSTYHMDLDNFHLYAPAWTEQERIAEAKHLRSKRDSVTKHFSQYLSSTIRQGRFALSYRIVWLKLKLFHPK